MKSILKSKIVWFNALMALSIFINQSQQYIENPQVLLNVTMVGNFITMLLRIFFTDTKLAVKPPKNGFTVITGLVLLTPLTAKAQDTNLGYYIYRDFKTHTTIQCVSTRITTFSDLSFIGDVDLNGVMALHSQTSLGISASKSFSLASNLDFGIGWCIRSEQNLTNGELTFTSGLVLGFNYRL